MNSRRKSPSDRSVLRTAMELDFLILGMDSDGDLRYRLASDLQALANLIPIKHAHVSLEQSSQVTVSRVATRWLLKQRSCARKSATSRQTRHVAPPALVAVIVMIHCEKSRGADHNPAGFLLLDP